MGEIFPLELPKFGMTMEEGVVDVWLVAEGEAFRKGQPICTVESSKISNDLEAPFDGVLRRIVAISGEELPVGALIGVSADPSVPESEIDAYVATRIGQGTPPSAVRDQAVAATAVPGTAPAGAVQAPAIRPAPAPDRPGGQEAGGSLVVPDLLLGSAASDVFATPHAHLFAERAGIDISRVSGSGPGGRVSLSDIHEAIRAAGGRVPEAARPERAGRVPRSHEDDSRVAATPMARRVAARIGVNLHDCRVSGTQGRVSVEDVESAARRLGLGSVPIEPSESSGPGGTQRREAFEQSGVEIPMTGMRKTIGSRLQYSVTHAPHFRVAHDLVIDRMLALRKQINADVPGVRVSVNDLLVKAVALALVAVPDLNIQYDEDSKTVTRFAHADISVAVSIDGGLITPIVRGADTRSVTDISATIGDLVTRAKTGRLAPEEFQGGTFSVSNLGMYGVPAFDAIINPPQAAILAIGAARTVPWFEDQDVVPRTVLTVTLSSDHRVVDGALAAEFLAELAAIVATPARLIV